MGEPQGIYGLGQAAVATTDGSIIVRKDWKVLLVNSAGLPTSVWPATHELSMPSRRRSQMSFSVVGTVTEPGQLIAFVPDVHSGQGSAEVEGHRSASEFRHHMEGRPTRWQQHEVGVVASGNT